VCWQTISAKWLHGFWTKAMIAILFKWSTRDYTESEEWYTIFWSDTVWSKGIWMRHLVSRDAQCLLADNVFQMALCIMDKSHLAERHLTDTMLDPHSHSNDCCLNWLVNQWSRTSWSKTNWSVGIWPMHTKININPCYLAKRYLAKSSTSEYSISCVSASWYHALWSKTIWPINIRLTQ